MPTIEDGGRGPHRQPWIAMVGVLLLAIQACAPTTDVEPAQEPAAERSPAALIAVPEPDLAGAEPRVREQIEAQQRVLHERLASDTDPARLGDTFGDLGLLYVTYSFLAAAEVSFVNARRLLPEDYRWPYLLGYLYQIQGRPEAAEVLERALDLAPSDLPASIRLGQVRLEEGDSIAARELFERALELDANSAAALDGLGQAAAASGDLRSAADYFERALALQPSASSMRHALGLAYRRLDMLDAAREQLALGGDGPVVFPDPLLQPVSELGRSAEIFLVRAAQAFSEQRYRVAASNYRHALELDPSDFTTHKALGFCLEKLGDVDGALEQLHEALRLGTTGDEARDTIEQAEIYRIMGGLEVLHGQENQALEHLKASLELDPDRLDTRIKLANALARDRRFAEAVEHYDLILRDKPDHSQTLVRRGTALINLEQPQAALADFQAAVATAPADPQVRLKYAEALEFLGEPGAAAEARRVAERLASGSVQPSAVALDDANARLRDGDYAGAINSYRSALRGDPMDTDTRFQLASVLAHVGRYEEALAELDRVIDEAPLHGPARRAQVTALLLEERYREARLKLQEGLGALPGDRQLAHALARLLASAPDDVTRNGALALELAERVYRARSEPFAAETLAMAYAEVGRFDQAVAMQQDLLVEAQRRGEDLRVQGLQRRLDAYRNRRPWRASTPDEIIVGTLSESGVG